MRMPHTAQVSAPGNYNCMVYRYILLSSILFTSITGTWSQKAWQGSTIKTICSPDTTVYELVDTPLERNFSSKSSFYRSYFILRHSVILLILAWHTCTGLLMSTLSLALPRPSRHCKISVSGITGSCAFGTCVTDKWPTSKVSKLLM